MLHLQEPLWNVWYYFSWLFGFIFVGKKIIFLWLSNGVQEFHLDKATLQLQLPERSEKTRVAYWHVLCMERNSLSLSFWIQRRVLGVSLLVCHVNTWCRPPCSKRLSVNDYRVAIRRRCDAWNCESPGNLEYAKNTKKKKKKKKLAAGIGAVRIVRPHWTSVSVARKLPRRCK
jgi:hypothetical protein